MALIVEDGTVLSSSANAYISVEDATEYHADRNNTAWAALSEVEQEAAILYATAWIDAKYRWRGTIVDDEQALSLPTEGGYDDQGREITGVPLRVAHATAELALIHATAPLNSVLGPRVIEQEVVGAVRRVFSDRNGNEGNRYPIVEKLLTGLHNSGGVQFIESMSA